MTVKPVIVTYDTHADHPGLARLIRSLDKWGWEKEVVIERGWRGFGRRLKAVVERCRTLGDRYTHAIHVDARDVVFVAPPSDFVAPPVPLLFATEQALWPPVPGLKELYPPPPSMPFCHAHSQYTVDLSRLDLLNCDDIPDHKDDQLHAHEVFLSGNPEVALDYNCVYVQSVAHCHPWQKFFAVEGERVRNLLTGSLPLSLHGNGQTTMTWIPGCQ